MTTGETLEEYRVRTGTGKGINLGALLHPPRLTDEEIEAVCRRDLGCTRLAVYRDLGRGGENRSGARRPLAVPYDSEGA